MMFATWAMVGLDYYIDPEDMVVVEGQKPSDSEDVESSEASYQGTC